MISQSGLIFAISLMRSRLTLVLTFTSLALQELSCTAEKNPSLVNDHMTYSHTCNPRSNHYSKFIYLQLFIWKKCASLPIVRGLNRPALENANEKATRMLAISAST